MKLSNAPFEKFYQFGTRCLDDCIRRGDMQVREPILYHAYVSEGQSAFHRTHCRTLSEYLSPQSPWIQDPHLASTRESLVRLMAIAVKAHYFLFQLDLLLDDPLVFWLPDVAKPHKDRFGLYCPFLKSKKALIVSSVDLASISFSGRLSLGRFPVVLTSDYPSWFDQDHWKFLALEADYMRLLQDPFSIPDASLARQHKDPSTFHYGTLFDVPDDLRLTMRQVGLRSADALNMMYLPKTFDLAPVQAYFDYLLAQRYHAHHTVQSFLSKEKDHDKSLLDSEDDIPPFE